MIRLKFFKISLLIVIPVLVFLTAFSIKNYEGPYWLGSNSDPEYVYLLNSLNLSQFRQVQYVDHPGTTLEVLGAGVIKVFHKIRAKDTIINDVLHNPELYLNAINLVIVLTLVLSILLIGLLTLFLTGNILFALIIQATPFLSYTLLNTLYRVSPEPLMLVATMWFSFIVLYIFYNCIQENPVREHGDELNADISSSKMEGSSGREAAGGRYNKEKYSKFSIFLLAILSGFLITTKIDSAPIVIVPLVFLKWKEKITYFLVTFLGLIFFTLPIYNRYSWFLNWTYRIFIHSGYFGQGSANIVNLPSFLQNLKTIFNTESFLVLSIFILTVSCLVFIVQKRKFNWNKYAFAILAFYVLDVLIVAKHFDNHYLVPSLSVLGLSSVMILSILKNSKIRIIAGILILIFAGRNLLFEIHSTKGISPYYQESIKIDDFVNENYPTAIKVSYYRSSSIEYALNFGNEWAFHRYDKQLSEMYPNNYFYEIWSEELYNWGNLTTLPNYGSIIFQGTPFKGAYLKYKPDLVMQDVYKGDSQTVYLVHKHAPH